MTVKPHRRSYMNIKIISLPVLKYKICELFKNLEIILNKYMQFRKKLFVHSLILLFFLIFKRKFKS